MDRCPALLYDPLLKRVWLFGRRVHHGAAGFVLAALGGALMLHDRADWRDWF